MICVNCKRKPAHLLHVISIFYDITNRYARWSLGFVDPPLEISGKGDTCTISALNARGKVLLVPVLDAMEKLNADGALSQVSIEDDVISVKVAPPAEVGTFSEEERSKQVSLLWYSFLIMHMFVEVHSLVFQLIDTNSHHCFQLSAPW